MINKLKSKLRLDYISGLKKIVLKELSEFNNLEISEEKGNSFYINTFENLEDLKNLKSVSKIYLIIQGSKYNPLYISNHKSILNNLIGGVINKDEFKTFKIECAGSNSPKVRSIAEYIQKEFNLIEKDKADLKIHIIKFGDMWEVGVQITKRPLSFRDYKTENIPGAMDPTIAYAMNSLCGLEKKNSYLNIFSGSATLLIEAGLIYKNINKLIGFDNNKKHISSSIQNIKQAGLIKNIQIKEMDILDNPNLGKFDVITSDLPFGMSISKNDNLEELYKKFLECCQNSLSEKGVLAVYTHK